MEGGRAAATNGIRVDTGAAAHHRLRPALSLSLAVNYPISGLDVWSYHVFNPLVHGCNALLVFGGIRRALQSPQHSPTWGSHVDGVALSTALQWAAHPLQTMYVTYAIQRG